MRAVGLREGRLSGGTLDGVGGGPRPDDWHSSLDATCVGRVIGP
jgi:hypothetical protein